MSTLATFAIAATLIKTSLSQSQSLNCNTNIDLNRVCGPCQDIANTECNLNCVMTEDICVESILTCQSGIPCNIQCSSLYSCMDSIVDATLSSALTMNCGSATACEGSQVVAGTGTDIIMNCNGVENSCKDLILNAATAGNVIVNCDGFNSCNGVTINAQNAQNVHVNCNNLQGGVCNAVKLNCGQGDCSIDCAGAAVGAAVKCNSIQVTYTALTRSFTCIGDPLTECFAAPAPFTGPTIAPSKNPTSPPSTFKPTLNPTQVTPTPSSIPTISPTKIPTSSPNTARPTSVPTVSPSSKPSIPPTNMPSTSPTDPSLAPTRDPTVQGQTLSPSKTPTNSPTTKAPTTSSPTTTKTPTKRPTTISPTTPGTIPDIPTLPTVSPTSFPTPVPTGNPTTAEPTTSSPTTDQEDAEICCECAAATLSTKGCAVDPGCTKTICELDPYCCENQWDNTCAYYASDQCAKTQQIAPETTAQRQDPPSDLDLVWKFALVVFAVMVFIVSCCIILLRIHRMCQNCKQKKLLQQKSVSAKKVKKRGKDGKLMRRGDSIKKLRSGGWSGNDGVNGHRIIAQKSPQPHQIPTPANSSLYGTRANSIKSFRSSHKGSGDSIDDESMTMTHEDNYDETEHRDVVPPNVSSNGHDLKRQQSHKMYIKRQYSSNNNIHGEHGHGSIPISGAQSVGSSHYSSQYGGMSSMNNSYNNPYGIQQPRGMNIVNNMAHFVAPRSLPAHNKLASNSVPPRHLIMGNGAHIDLEYGTDSNQDRFIVNDMMDDHDVDPDEDSLSMSDETHNFGVHSPNTFAMNKAPKKGRGSRQVKDSMNSSVDSSINISQMQHVRVQKSKRKKLTKESTETSVDDSEVALEDNVNELKQEILELKETVKGSKNKSKKKKQRERRQSAVRQSDVKGAPGQTEEDSNNSGGSGSRDSEDTDEEVTVSDDPISEIMNNLKRMQSVKHHSI